MTKIIKSLCWLLLAFNSFLVQANNILPGEELFKTPYYSSPQISPDGKFVIGKLDDGQKRELVITDVKTQQRYPVVFFAKRNYLRNFYWIDNNSIYIEYISGKSDKQSLIDLDINNLAQKSPTQQIEVNGYLLSALPSVKDEVIFARRLEENKLEVYQINTQHLMNNNFSAAKKLRTHLDDAFIYLYDDKNAAYFGFTFDAENKSAAVWFLAPESNRWKLLYDSNDLSYQLKAIQYLSENKFLVLTNKNSERMSVAVFDLVSQKVEKIVYEHPQFDIIDAEADEDTGELLSVSYVNRGNIETEYLQQELAEFESFIIESEDEEPVYTVGESEDGSKSLLFAYGAAHPGTYLLFDENKQSSTLIEHVYPHLIEHEFAKTRLVEVPLASGETQEGYLTIPYLNANGVLLVLLRTGGSAEETLTEFSRSVQYLANRGYAVLRVDYQSPIEFGSAEEGEPLVRINTELENNIHQLVKDVTQQFGYDRTCSVGYGYGSYSAMRLSMLFADDYHCVISMFGIYDFQLLFSADNAQALNLNQQAVKDLLQKDSSFVQQSPVYLAKNYNKPVLMVAGENDDIAVPEQFNRMKYVLKKQTDRFEHHVFRDTEHGLSTWFEEQQIHAVVDEFLRRQLNLPTIETLAGDVEAAKEYVKISDMYSFDTLTENNISKSFEYVVKASRLGHPRAMFNRGSHYHRGELVEKNINKAIEWYKKASDAGYEDASFRLGEIYENNPDVEQDLLKAYQYFLKANEQGFDARAGLRAANYVCKGEVVERDVELCKALFDIYQIKTDNLKNRQIKVNKKSEKLWRNMLSELMLAPGNTPELQMFYKRLLNEKFGIVDTKMRFELVEEGLFSNKGMEDLIKGGTRLEARNSTKVGIRFKLHKETKSIERNAIIFRVMEKSKEDKDKVVLQKISQKWGKMHEQDWFMHKFIGKNALHDADYELQIYNLDAELLYSQTFSVRKDD